MKAHELAKKLLEGPDYTVVVQDGSYLSDWCKVSDIDADKIREIDVIKLDGWDTM